MSADKRVRRLKYCVQIADSAECGGINQRLIQLCDALSLPAGVVSMESRLIDVALRHGFNDYTAEKWKAFYRLKAYFDCKMGGNIYTI